MTLKIDWGSWSENSKSNLNKKPKKMEQQVSCVCLSDWCKTSRDQCFADVCNNCGKGFASTDGRLVTTLLVGCKCIFTRMHSWPVSIHEHCTLKFDDPDVESVPLYFDQINRKQIEEIRTVYFKRHPQKLTKCAACGVDINNKTKKCKGCRHVFYCNLECQKVHWDKHKTFCKTHKGLITLEWCSCFNDLEQLYYERFKNQTCCSKPCTNSVDPKTPQMVAMMFSDCLKKGVVATHMLPKIFCSDKCREKDTNEHFSKEEK
jgi:hypothetical protein